MLEELVDFSLVIISVNDMELWKSSNMAANRLHGKLSKMRHEVDLWDKHVSSTSKSSEEMTRSFSNS